MYKSLLEDIKPNKGRKEMIIDYCINGPRTVASIYLKKYKL